MASIKDRLAHAWNAFNNKDPTTAKNVYTSGYGYRPDAVRMTRGNDRSIITSIYTRMAVDAAQSEINHVRLDKDGRLKETMVSMLQECLSVEANLDQASRAFRTDVYLTLLDEGHVAIVPTHTDKNPTLSESYDIKEMRVGRVKEWHPTTVAVEVYNPEKGEREVIVLPKKMVAIVQNPFYTVMNAPNSILQRLIYKLNLLDAVDEQSSSGKLDLIIQLPYVIKSEARKQQAEQRRQDIENQLSGSKYGIAYTDGTEHITQLNRSVENNLLKQIEYLTNLLYSQLGITQEIMDGTADASVMSNYYARTIEPIVSAVVDEMKRKFLSKTARTQGQTIRYFRDPFKLVAIQEMPDLIDKVKRSEVMSSNEIREKMGLAPFNDDKADMLINSNISMSKETEAQINGGETTAPNQSEEVNQNGA